MRIQAVNYFPGGLRRREGLNCSICRPTNHASLCKFGEVDQICTLLPPERGGSGALSRLSHGFGFSLARGFNFSRNQT